MLSGWDELTADMHESFKNTFGEEVSCEPLSGGSHTLDGVFNDKYTYVDPDTEQGISSTQPVLGVKLSDLTRAPTKGDVLVIRGVRYKIRDSQEDGEGWLHLFLYKK